MISYIVVIPARLKSKRLPFKPLIKIKGIPMIIRTFNQCSKAVPQKRIIVATDSKQIINICNEYGVNAILTSKNCKTGTDRVAEVSKKIKAKIYINLQGDEPIFPPKDIKKFIDFSLKNKNKIINGYTKINLKKDYEDRNVPKVVFDNKENLIYMSRSPIPGNKSKKFVRAWRQVCIYSFPKKILKKIILENKKNTLEKIEDIEIIRFLEKGYNVKLIEMSDKSIPVDKKSDLKKVLKVIEQKNNEI